MITLPDPTRLPDGNHHYFTSPDTAAQVIAIAPENIKSWPKPTRPLVCFRLDPKSSTRVTELSAGLVRYEVDPAEMYAALRAIAAIDSAFQLQLAA